MEGEGWRERENIWLFFEGLDEGLEVGAEGADFLDGGAKLSVEGFVLLNLSGDDGEDSICPLWYRATLIENRWERMTLLFGIVILGRSDEFAFTSEKVLQIEGMRKGITYIFE